MRTEDEIKYKLALLVESIDGDQSQYEAIKIPMKVIAIRELEWVLGIREK